MEKTYKNHKFYDRACRAYYATSFSPEKRAESECQFWDSLENEFSGNPDALARLERLFLDVLSAKSRCASPMITGPAKFPTERNNRAMERERKLSDKLFYVLEKIRNPKIKVDHSIESVQDELDKMQAQLVEKKEANAKLRACTDWQEVHDSILDDEVRGRFEVNKRLMRRDGFMQFELTNLRNRIKTMEEKLATYKASDSQAEIVKDGVRIVKNITDDRLQIFHDSKPEAETISSLKKNGFKWSPRNKCWQRQLTQNAINSLSRLGL
jgi:hypothetical protein